MSSKADSISTLILLGAENHRKKIIKVGTTSIGQVGFEPRYAEASYSFPIAHKDYYLVQSTQGGILENNSYEVSKSKQQTT